MAASVSVQMSPVLTTIDSVTGGVKIAWTAPFNNGDSIIAYKIEIQDSTGTTWN